MYVILLFVAVCSAILRTYSDVSLLVETETFDVSDTVYIAYTEHRRLYFNNVLFRSGNGTLISLVENKTITSTRWEVSLYDRVIQISFPLGSIWPDTYIISIDMIGDSQISENLTIYLKDTEGLVYVILSAIILVTMCICATLGTGIVLSLCVLYMRKCTEVSGRTDLVVVK